MLKRETLTADEGLMGTSVPLELAIPEGVDVSTLDIKLPSGKLVKCDEEPIHTPGAIQDFGVLFVIDRNYKIRQISQNTESILGICYDHLLGTSVLDLVKDSSSRSVFVQQCRKVSGEPANGDPHVFTLMLTLPTTKPGSSTPDHQVPFYAALHKIAVPAHMDKPEDFMFICELELCNDQLHPLDPSPQLEHQDRHEPEFSRWDEDAEMGFEEPGALNFLSVMTQLSNRLGKASRIEELVQLLSRIFLKITGFDRVLIYQFDEEWNGDVLSESRNESVTTESFYDLHFPATDLPSQARELYKLDKCRCLYDRLAPTAKIVMTQDLKDAPPLDMSCAFLRALSPIHLKYLENMGVRSIMSIPLMNMGQLWGLISCHAYRPKRVTFLARSFFRNTSEMISSYIEKLWLVKRLEERTLIQKVTAETPSDEEVTRYAPAREQHLLTSFDADYAVICIDGTPALPDTSDCLTEIQALIEYIQSKNWDKITHSRSILEDFPDYTAAKRIAGFLHIPFTPHDKDFVTLLRYEQVEYVKWGGNPHEKHVVQHPYEKNKLRLEPRNSFKLWQEAVRGKSKRWTEGQLEMAGILQLLYIRFITVFRAMHSAMEKSRLKNVLLRNASHEDEGRDENFLALSAVRRQLTATLNNLESALHRRPDDVVAAKYLTRSQDAGKSLLWTIDDLLNLAQVQDDAMILRKEPFPIQETIRNVAQMFEIDAAQRNLEFFVLGESALPKIVIGDRGRFRQILTNLCSNALKYTSRGHVRVDCAVLEKKKGSVVCQIAVADTGVGIPNDKMAIIFQSFEQVDVNRRAERQGFGLGLAIVSSIIQAMHGELKVESELNKGSRFTVILEFELPPEMVPLPEGAIEEAMSKYTPTASSSSSH
ncbi:Light-sensor Protein kinase [Quaeritorhiza haematococci]|nr:Light-sensor Protein kinase [Quaeritorhiza haematococci]